jgi:peptide deformylase
MISLKDYRLDRSALRQVAAPIKLEYLQTEEYKQNLEKMREILKRDGVGLAATQVGWPVQLFLLAIDENENELSEPQIILNPTITEYSKKTTKMEEGCLSFPGLFLKIIRPTSITWDYTSPDGEAHSQKATGFYARAIQHEVDHLRGKVFIDKASPVLKLKVDKWLKAS